MAPIQIHIHDVIRNLEKGGGGGINMNAGSRGAGGCIMRSTKFNEADMRAFVLTQSRVQFVLNMCIISSQLATFV